MISLSKLLLTAYFFSLTIFSNLLASDLTTKEEEYLSRAKISMSHALPRQSSEDKDLAGLRILDIGSGGGGNAYEMMRRGAIVEVVEPIFEEIKFSVESGHVLPEYAHHAKIEDNFEERLRSYANIHNIDMALHEESLQYRRSVKELGEEFNGRFDIVTIFMIAMDEGAAAERLAKLLKPKGKLIIGYATAGEYVHSHAGPRKALETFFSIDTVNELGVLSNPEDPSCCTTIRKGVDPWGTNDVYVTFTKKED